MFYHVFSASLLLKKDKIWYCFAIDLWKDEQNECFYWIQKYRKNRGCKSRNGSFRYAFVGTYNPYGIFYGKAFLQPIYKSFIYIAVCFPYVLFMRIYHVHFKGRCHIYSVFCGNTLKQKACWWKLLGSRRLLNNALFAA